MLKKIIISVLLITVIGAAGAALAYNATNQDTATATTSFHPLANEQNFSASEDVSLGQTETVAQDEPFAQGMEGETWQAIGTIAAIDENGFDFTLESGETVYIELGPSDYWQSQNIELSAGQTATVVGSINEDMIHASQVALAEDQVLVLRSETGQPMWSGGVSNSRGQNSEGGDGDHTPDPKAQIDEWVTLEGTLISFQGGNMTMSTADGVLISFKTGQPRFFAEQGVTFQVGDEVSVLGFYEGEQFMAGEISQLSTSLRVMLRDPNGRPLWAGPGSGNGNGNGGNGNSGSNGNGGS